jgi:hypothetical protein
MTENLRERREGVEAPERNEMNGNWSDASAAHHEGAIDFAEFARRTERERRGWVGKLRRQLEPIPVWHGAEDSAQDFLVDLFVRTKTFEPSCSSAGGYFHFAVKAVGKRIQKARGVEQHRRMGSPRFERVVSAVYPEDPPEVPDSAADLERAFLRKQYYEILCGLCDTPKQLAVVCALRACGGSLAGATAHIYADPDVRRDLRLGSEREATATINRVVDELIAAYGDEDEDENESEEEAQS